MVDNLQRERRDHESTDQYRQEQTSIAKRIREDQGEQSKLVSSTDQKPLTARQKWREQNRAEQSRSEQT